MTFVSGRVVQQMTSKSFKLDMNLSEFDNEASSHPNPPSKLESNPRIETSSTHSNLTENGLEKDT